MKSQSRNGRAINIYLNNNICNEIDKLAENMGVSRSTMITIMARQYVDGTNAISVLKDAIEMTKGGIN